MPSLNTFNIEFDQPDAVYTPGGIVSGCVIINLAKEKIAEALKLSTTGQAHVTWDDNIATSVTYWKIEKYFDLTIPLLEKTEDDEKVHIPAGLNRYPFRIQLPRDIPSSFEHSNGYIRYTIEAIIVRSWRFNHVCKAAFTIIATYDLNIRREQCIAICDEVNQAFSCLHCIKLGSINMRVKIPTTGFVPGQWIEVILELREFTVTNLQKICVKLQQSLDLRSTTSKTRVTVTVVAVEKIGPFDKHTVIALRLHIPSVPPSLLEFCNIIHLQYILCIVLHSSKIKIVKQYPILIGTIPLWPALSALAVSSSPHVSQSTSKNEDVPMIPESDIAQNAPCPDSSSVNEFLDPLPLYEKCYMSSTFGIQLPIFINGTSEIYVPKYPVFTFAISHYRST